VYGDAERSRTDQQDRFFAIVGWADYDLILSKKVHQLDPLNRNKFRVKVGAVFGRPAEEDAAAGDLQTAGPLLARMESQIRNVNQALTSFLEAHSSVDANHEPWIIPGSYLIRERESPNEGPQSQTSKEYHHLTHLKTTLRGRK
jgi:hypothetical protein